MVLSQLWRRRSKVQGRPGALPGSQTAVHSHAPVAPGGECGGGCLPGLLLGRSLLPRVPSLSTSRGPPQVPSHGARAHPGAHTGSPQQLLPPVREEETRHGEAACASHVHTAHCEHRPGSSHCLWTKNRGGVCPRRTRDLMLQGPCTRPEQAVGAAPARICLRRARGQLQAEAVGIYAVPIACSMLRGCH